MMFINKWPTIYQNNSGINPIGISAPWVGSYLEPQQK